MKALLPILAVAASLLAATTPAEPKLAPPAHPKHRTNLCDLPDTPSITACSAKAQAGAEQRLNATYQAALKASEPEDQEKLRNVQRLWLQYRQAECQVESEANSTLRSAYYSFCVAQLDQIRTDELKTFYLN